MWWGVGQVEFARAVVVLHDALLGCGWFLDLRLLFPCCSITLIETACYFPIVTQI